MAPGLRTPLPWEFRADVALPPGLTAELMCDVIKGLLTEWAAVDRAVRRTARPSVGLAAYLSGNGEVAAVSGLLSRRVVELLAAKGPFVRGERNRFPDLWSGGRRPVALEVKATRLGGGNRPSGHNPETGTYLVIRFSLCRRGLPQVAQVLIGHLDKSALRTCSSARRTRTSSIRMRSLSVWYQSPTFASSCALTRRQRAARVKVTL